VAVDRLHVKALLDVADSDHRLESRAERALGEELRQGGRRVLADDPNGGRHVAAAQGKPSRQQVGKTRQKAACGILGRGLAPDDRDFAAASLEPDAEGIFDGPQVFVGDSEERSQSGFGQGYGVVRFRNRRCSLRR
jgi:hypothetical protein